MAENRIQFELAYKTLEKFQNVRGVFKHPDPILMAIIEAQSQRLEQAAFGLGREWNGMFNDGHVKMMVAAYLDMTNGSTWISVEDRLPVCDMTDRSFGVEVRIKPKFDGDVDDTAFYGCRQTPEPNFYKYGAVIKNVTHWKPKT